MSYEHLKRPQVVTENCVLGQIKLTQNMAFRHKSDQVCSFFRHQRIDLDNVRNAFQLMYRDMSHLILEETLSDVAR